jgi:hypothetical protein
MILFTWLDYQNEPCDLTWAIELFDWTISNAQYWANREKENNATSIYP